MEEMMTWNRRGIARKKCAEETMLAWKRGDDGVEEACGGDDENDEKPLVYSKSR